MVCDAELELKITGPQTTKKLSTDDKTIMVNPECSQKQKVEKDDFESKTQFSHEGEYALKLTAKTKNGTYTIQDKITVKQDNPFSIERVSRTRIYPVKTYDMKINVIANRDFTGTITETVPQEFQITHNDKSPEFIESMGEITTDKTLEWNVKLKKGDKITLEYTYDSPDITPWFFTTGPLEFISPEQRSLHSENRRWQIAVDDIAPVGYWKFNEATGQSANDSSPETNNGTLGANSSAASDDPTWEQDNECIQGKCLIFDGVDDYVLVPNSTSLNPTTITTSAWIKVNTTVSGKEQAIISKWGDTSFQDTFNFNIDNNKVKLSVKLGSGWQSVTGVTNLDTNTWYHLAGTFDGSNIKVYVNGRLDATTSQSGSITSSTATVRIGRAGSLVSNQFFAGLIDEPKVYDFAKTDSQIKSEYNARGSLTGTAATVGHPNYSTQQLDFIDENLAAYWNMNETPNTTTVADSSGNGNNGTSSTSSNISNGWFGRARTFNGSNQFVSVGNGSSLSPGANSFTISAWIKTSSNTSQKIYAKDNCSSGSLIQFDVQSSNIVRFQIGNSSRTVSGVSSSGTVADGNWHHVVGMRDTANGTLKVFIDGVLDNSASDSIAGQSVNNSATAYIGRCGTFNTEVFNGSIDEVRIYSTALTNSQVGLLYANSASPIGYWDLEEGSGTTANDRSTFGNTGTITGATYTTGKVGKGLIFDGTDDVINAGSASNLDDLSQLSVGMWMYHTGGSSIKALATKTDASTANGWVFTASNLGGSYLAFSADYSTTDLSCTTGTGAFSSNVWQHVAVTWDGTATCSGVKVYVNGIQISVSGASGVGTRASDASNNLLFADTVSSGNTYGGILDEIKLYNYVRNNQQVVENMNADHPTGGSPIGSQIVRYKFDEGYGSTTNNSVRINPTITGTINGATWTNDGKYNRALNFDGVNDYIQVANPGSFPAIEDGFTVSGWFYVDSSPSTTQNFIMIRSGVGNTLSVGTRGSGNLDAWASGGTVLVNTPFPTANAWHYFAYTYDGSTHSIYVDGILRNTSGSASNTGVPDNIRIGSENGAEYFDGILDEMKVYSSALTASQIAIDYNFNNALVVGNLGTTSTGTPDNSAIRNYCQPGSSLADCTPVLDFTFEGNVGSDTYDVSGNNAVGAVLTATLANGKVGKGYSFPSAGEVEVPSAQVAADIPQKTVMAWFYARGYGASNGGRIAQKGSSGWYMTFNSTNNRLQFVQPYTSGTSGFQTNTNMFQLNKWHHLVVMYDYNADTARMFVDGSEVTVNTFGTPTGSPTSDASQALIIGNNNANNRGWDGIIDEFKMYDYFLSPEQILWEYNRGKPYVHLKLDECTGSTAGDSSGNGKSGATTIGGSGTQSSVGDCSTSGTARFNGLTGKYNYSLNLDGTDDYISVATPNLPTGNFSYAAWVYPDATSGTMNIISAADGSGGDEVLVRSNSGGTVTIRVNGASDDLVSAQTLTASAWNHVLVTRNGSDISLYINGKKDTNTGSDGSVLSFSSCALLIGVDAGSSCTATLGGYFDGKVDDVKVFHYALTDVQARSLYNNGTIYWGPAQGAP
jgi:hypothetical protein